MTFCQKPIRQVRTEKTRAAGHDGNGLRFFGGHCAFLLMAAAQVCQQETFQIVDCRSQIADFFDRSLSIENLKS
jgi:hypothetical protein